ncbi:hypothetical protein [Streptomyces sp. NPDC048438]|uniref:hypothetical protein n=1 Tax=Streptomyces sp. NPDC048438 TaxID=3365551 RepID=UPI003710BE3B
MRSVVAGVECDQDVAVTRLQAHGEVGPDDESWYVHRHGINVNTMVYQVATAAT